MESRLSAGYSGYGEDGVDAAIEFASVSKEGPAYGYTIVHTEILDHALAFNAVVLEYRSQ